MTVTLPTERSNRTLLRPKPSSASSFHHPILEDPHHKYNIVNDPRYEAAKTVGRICEAGCVVFGCRRLSISSACW